MKHRDVRRAAVAAVGIGIGAISLVSCGGSAAAPPSAGSSPAGRARTAPAAAATGNSGPAVMGETLTPRVIVDEQQGGMPVGVVAVPASWRYAAHVEWNYANYSNPVVVWSSAENPASAEAVYAYPSAEYFALQPAAMAYFRQGQNYGGLVCRAPVPPVQALAGLVQQLRGGQPGFQWVGSKNLPGLPAALQIPPAPNQQGVGIKIRYTLDGTPVDEEFYAVAYAAQIPYDGPQGRTWQLNWGLTAVHSFRAPAGTIDHRRPVFAAVARSFRPNPAWQQRLKAIDAYLAEQFNRWLQAGYDSIAAAGRLSQQISANNDAMLSAIDAQLQSSGTPGAAASGTSAADAFDDYIRGVETTSDPYYGTSQHSADQQFHWTDGYGNYRDSNDASYDPNRTEVGQWQMMPPIR
jgi:hypothetical protein